MTVTAATFTRDFTEGWAQYIAANLDPTLNVVWLSTGRYDQAQTGIYIGGFPTDVAGQPNIGSAIALMPYPLADDPALNVSDIGLQTKCRAPGADVREAWALDDAIADLLLGNYPLTLPTGVAVAALNRSVSTSLGKDDAQRWIWSSSYPNTVHRPSQFRH